MASALRAAVKQYCNKKESLYNRLSKPAVVEIALNFLRSYVRKRAGVSLRDRALGASARSRPFGLRSLTLGDRDYLDDPPPGFIGAARDLGDLVAGLIEANDRMREDGLDPVLQAAATAFDFVCVHPSMTCWPSGSLARRMVFPISSVMLDRIDDYRRTLQAHSRPLICRHRVAANTRTKCRGPQGHRRSLSLFRLHGSGRIPLCGRDTHGRARSALRNRLSAPARSGDPPHHGCGRDAGPGSPRIS
jgi:hypothetical protein